MKIVLLSSAAANQRALAHRLAEVAPLDAILVYDQILPGDRSLGSKVGRLSRGALGMPLRKAWFEMLDRYDSLFPRFPVPPSLTVSDINDPAVHRAISSIKPDLVIVSGTNLLRQPLIDAITRTGKVMNLHTGISPYVRGAPNCTNWCLATRQFDLIGNTVMWIDKGVDSGNLIATEQTRLDGSESLAELHRKVMDHAHALLLRCVGLFIAGKDLPNVAQSELGSGQLFRSRQWNALAAAKAVFNFYAYYRKSVTRRTSSIRLVSPARSSGA